MAKSFSIFRSAAPCQKSGATNPVRAAAAENIKTAAAGWLRVSSLNRRQNPVVRPNHSMRPDRKVEAFKGDFPDVFKLESLAEA